MQVIEKVKVVPEGYNGAGMDGYGRRDVNGKANAGLTLGIIGTALGAWALFGNRRSAGVLGTGAGLMGDGSTNINVVGAGMGSASAPTAFQAWSKSCEDTLALQGGLYQWALTQQNQRFQDRQVIDGEMFGLYKSQIDADFLLYKGNRDNYDSLKAEISELKTQVAVSAAIRPYQDKLIQCEIERAFTAGINYVDKKTCNVIYGVTCLPYETDQDVRARSRRDEMYERINDFLARGGRGRSGRGGRGRGMMNRIGYKTYDNYDRDEQRGYGERHRYDESRGYDGSHGYDEEERMLLMQMLGVDGNERYNDYGDEHFNKQEAKRTVDEMYHVKDGKKYIGEKYDMQKAHEVCSKFKDKLEDEVEVADVYVAINAQYHDYCELFEKWFGKGNFDDMIFESAISFWFDDVDFGEDKLWKYFNELK